MPEPRVKLLGPKDLQPKVDAEYEQYLAMVNRSLADAGVSAHGTYAFSMRTMIPDIYRNRIREAYIAAGWRDVNWTFYSGDQRNPRDYSYYTWTFCP